MRVPRYTVRDLESFPDEVEFLGNQVHELGGALARAGSADQLETLAVHRQRHRAQVSTARLEGMGGADEGLQVIDREGVADRGQQFF